MQNNVIVEICNEALLESGQTNTITSLGENSELAELLNRLWKSTLDEVYASYAWQFKKRREMADLQTTDTVNVYAYPDDCLRVLGFYLDAGYQIPEKLARVGEDIHGVRKIYSPKTPLFIEYITGASTNNSLSPWVRRFLILSLALKIEAAKSTNQQITMQKWQECLDRAEELDASEDSHTHTYDDKFINCR